jgi:hypothetical protein
MSGSEQFKRLPGPGEKINGCSRSTIYEIGQQHKGVLVKVDRMTLVNMPKFNKVLSGYPPAKLKPPAKSPAA